MNLVGARSGAITIVVFHFTHTVEFGRMRAGACSVSLLTIPLWSRTVCPDLAQIPVVAHPLLNLLKPVLAAMRVG